MNFIALGVIAEIDDIYAQTLYNNRIKKELEDGYSLEIDESNAAKKEYKKKLSPAFIVYWILKTLYEGYYYYFMPFTVIAGTYFTQLMDLPTNIDLSDNLEGIQWMSLIIDWFILWLDSEIIRILNFLTYLNT